MFEGQVVRVKWSGLVHPAVVVAVSSDERQQPIVWVNLLVDSKHSLTVSLVFSKVI